MNKAIIILLQTCLAVSCSTKKLAVSHADTLIEHQILKRLPLYSAQKTALSQDVNNFLNAHKVTAKKMIPVVHAFELDATKVDSQLEELREFYQHLALDFSKLMTKYMVALDYKQQKDFQEVLEEENIKIKQLSTKDALVTASDRFEALFGNMRPEQEKILAKNSNYFIEQTNARLKRRQTLHERFVDIYQMDISKESRERYFNEAFVNFQKTAPSTARWIEMIKEVIPTLKEDQKIHFKEKIEELKLILRYFIEEDY